MMKLLVLLAAIAYGAVALQRLRARWAARLFPPPAPPRGYTVTIETPGGRAGHIEYRQGGDVCRLDWELLVGGKSVLHIWGPAPAAWDREVPWAAGRREQILSRVAEEVARQKCRDCRWELGDDGIRLFTA
jgi:hypothetical protein